MKKTLSMPPAAPPDENDVVLAALELIRLKLDVTQEAFFEMPILEVYSRLKGAQPYHNAKWTRGEVRRMVKDADCASNDDVAGWAIEILQYLCERGPRIIAWDDESDPEGEREAERDHDLDGYDAAIAGETKKS